MKTKLMALMLLAGSTMFAQHRFSIGIGFGYTPPPPVYVYSAPPAPVYAVVPQAPGYGYTWVGSYWYPSGARWLHHDGYWARAPYAHARWMAPHYTRGHYYAGYWRR